MGDTSSSQNEYVGRHDLRYARLEEMCHLALMLSGRWMLGVENYSTHLGWSDVTCRWSYEKNCRKIDIKYLAHRK